MASAMRDLCKIAELAEKTRWQCCGAAAHWELATGNWELPVGL